MARPPLLSQEGNALALKEFKCPDSSENPAAFRDPAGSDNPAMLHRYNAEVMNGQTRSQIHPGMKVRVVEKQNQRTGKLTEGVVQRILTKSPNHPHGIKVMLESGIVGRVKEILG
jgi:uncharacterized repeat protein (TIGR03833 family)